MNQYYRHKLNENAGDQKATWKVLNDLMEKNNHLLLKLMKF